jgi:hypothetical protein
MSYFQLLLLLASTPGSVAALLLQYGRTLTPRTEVRQTASNRLAVAGLRRRSTPFLSVSAFVACDACGARTQPIILAAKLNQLEILVLI